MAGFDAQAARAAAADPCRAARADHDRVARLLARAFADDPVMRWGFRDDGRRHRALRAYMRYVVGAQAAPHDAIFAARDFSATAVWMPPASLDALKLPFWRALLVFPRMVRIAGWSRLTRTMALGEAMDKHHPPAPPHWYLFFLGVEPALQGQGLGSAMLEATLKQVDAARLPAHLDNSNPKNTRLYERHGFRVVTEYRARPDAPPIQGMWRNARG